MSTQIDYARIVLLNRTSKELAAVNPVLLAGEAVISDVGTMTPSLRIGDGVRPWTALPRFGAGAQLSPPVLIPAGPDGTISLTVHGATGNVATQIIGGLGNSALEVMGASQTDPGWYYAAIHPLTDTTPAPGTSNGIDLAAGTNANDTNILLQSADGSRKFLRIRGDGTGFLGPNEQNSLRWDEQGKFTLGGSAEMPRQSVNQLADVVLTELADGNLLRWNGNRWVNVPPGDFAVTELTAGTGLTGGTIGPPGGTIGLADTGVTPGEYTRADITVDAQGRITEVDNGAALTLQELVDVGTMDPEPTDGEFLGWEANLHRWLNIHPALAGLADVSIASPAADDVLVFNGETNKWVNSGLPGGQVIALSTLMDTNITDPQEGEVLTWDSASERWVNGAGVGALASLSDVALNDLGVGELLTYNGTKWQNNGWAYVNSETHDAFTAYARAGYWAGVFQNLASGGHGLIVQAGTLPTDTAFQVNAIGGFPTYMRIFGDGHGYVGANSINNLSWTSGGNIVVNTPAGGTALIVNGNSIFNGSYSTFQTDDAGGALVANWINHGANGVGLAIYGSAYSGGSAFGVGPYGVALSTSSAATFAIGTMGAGFLSFGTSGVPRLQISPTGEITINAPSWGGSGIPLTVNGVPGAAAISLRAGESAWGIDLYGSNVDWGSWGLNVMAGTRYADYCAMFRNYDASRMYFRINGDGGGSLSEGRLTWGDARATGGFTMNAATGTDWSLLVYNASQSTTVLGLRADGRIWLPNISTGAGSANLFRSSANSLLYDLTSSGRYKRDISSIARAHARQIVPRLRAVSFKSKCRDDDPDLIHYGLIAEEVAAVDRSLVTFDNGGEPKSVNYDRIALLLLPLVQEILGMDEPEATYG